MAKKKGNRSNCRPPFRISHAGHLLRVEGSSDAGHILSTEAKKEKKKRQKRGCLNGTGATFRLTARQKKMLPKHLQKAILAHHKKQGKTIIN